MDKVIVNKNSICFGEYEIKPPFTRKDVEAILGTPTIKDKQLTKPKANDDTQVYVWDDYGIAGNLNKDKTCYSSFIINMNKKRCYYKYIEGLFEGTVYIGTNEYKDCIWKYLGVDILKFGNFECYTLTLDSFEKVKDSHREKFANLVDVVQVVYKEPRKLVKYKQTPIGEPELRFSDFNFKLAVIQELMYKKELLVPKFEVDEFAKEYPKREINPAIEGDYPIKEVVDWFKKLQIPASLASEVDEICMDGGNEIYHQIIPFWNGEDNYFDLKKITTDDIVQLTKLNKITIMSECYKKIAKVFEDNGIKTEQL